MFNFQILDVAIGLTFIYFFLSLICSVLNEAWAGLIKKRSKMLEQAIASLLQDEGALTRLYQQPLFLGTTPKGSFSSFWSSFWNSFKPSAAKPSSPSYISSRSFVLSLLESLKQHPEVIRNILQEIIRPPEDETKLKEFEERLAKLPDKEYPHIKTALNAVLKSALNDPKQRVYNIQEWYALVLKQPQVLAKVSNDLKTQKLIPSLKSKENIIKLVNYLPDGNDVKKALVPLLESVGQGSTDLDKVLAAMEKWYDEAMERVTGWYKRYSQTFTLMVAFVVALALNADTFAISQAIYRDQTLRTSLVAMAEKEVKQSSPAVPSASPRKDNKGKTKLLVKPTAQGSAQPVQAGSQQSGPGAAVAKSGKKVKAGQQKPAESIKTEDQQQAELKAKADKLNTYFKEIKGLNLPLGWDNSWSKWIEKFASENKAKKDLAIPEGSPNYYLHLLFFLLGNLGPHLPGILFTALLVSLGSNFWFELLNKLINLRNAGKKPLTAQEAEAQKT